MMNKTITLTAVLFLATLFSSSLFTQKKSPFKIGPETTYIDVDG